MKPIKVLLVDDHAIVRAGLRALLEAAGDMEVAGEAENGQQAVSEAERLWPDVVLLDLAMPLLNGVGAARKIARRVPTAKVLILSSYSDAQHLREAIEAGVAGYLMKESAGDNLLESIREARDGGAPFSPPLLVRLSKEYWEARRDSRRPVNGTPTLSRRQEEVLQLVAEGFANKQIAGLLRVSVKTVEKHRQSIMTKLSIHKTAMLTRYAVSSGMVETSLAPIWPVGSGPARPQVRREAEPVISG